MNMKLTVSNKVHISPVVNALNFPSDPSRKQKSSSNIPLRSLKSHVEKSKKARLWGPRKQSKGFHPKGRVVTWRVVFLTATAGAAVHAVRGGGLWARRERVHVGFALELCKRKRRACLIVGHVRLRDRRELCLRPLAHHVFRQAAAGQNVVRKKAWRGVCCASLRLWLLELMRARAD